MNSNLPFFKTTNIKIPKNIFVFIRVNRKTMQMGTFHSVIHLFIELANHFNVQTDQKLYTDDGHNICVKYQSITDEIDLLIFLFFSFLCWVCLLLFLFVTVMGAQILEKWCTNAQNRKYYYTLYEPTYTTYIRIVYGVCCWYTLTHTHFTWKNIVVQEGTYIWSYINGYFVRVCWFMVMQLHVRFADADRFYFHKCTMYLSIL